MKHLLKARLLNRGYPQELIDSTSKTVSYQSRQQLLQPKHTPKQRCYPPLLKCYPPPQFKMLKDIILQNYNLLSKLLPFPRFIALKYPTLYNQLVTSRVNPTTEQTFDILFQLHNQGLSILPLSYHNSPCNPQELGYAITPDVSHVNI